MAALDENVSRPWREGDVAVLPVAAGANVRQGSLLSVDAAGRVAPATAAANLRFVGVAIEPADNRTGAAGAISVTARIRGCFRFAAGAGRTITPGEECRQLDDNTVTDDTAVGSRVGRCVAADAEGVWVVLDSMAQ